MNYSKTVERAWHITWKHRSMWVYGFLLALFSIGSGGNGGRGMQYTLGSGDRVPGPWVVGLIAAAVGVALVLAIASLVLRYVSEAALIGMVSEVEETGQTSLRSGWHSGWPRFVHLLAIDLLIGIVGVAVALILLGIGVSPLLLLLADVKALTIIGIAATVGLTMLAIATLIVFVTLVSVLREFAFRACALSDQGALSALRSSYQVLRQSGRQVVGIWLAMLGIGLAVNLAAIPVMLLIAALVGGPAMAIYALTEAVVPTILIAAFFGFFGALFMAAVLSVYRTFRSTVWTLTYQEVVPSA